MRSYCGLKIIALAIAMAMLSGRQIHGQKTLADGIKDLASQVTASAAKEQKKRIAVLPFRELDGQATILSSYLSEELVTNLFLAGGMDIVERSMLDKLIGEIRLNQTGIIDPETAKTVGKVAGVDAIVTGSITDLQSYIALNCRLIDAQTGRIFAAAQTKIVKDDDVRKIMGTMLPKPNAQEQRSVTPEKAISTAKKVITRDAGGFSFELKACALKGTRVDCELQITNTANDRGLTLYANFYGTYSRLIDINGSQFVASGVSLAGYSPSDGEASLTLVSGVPVRGRLVFDGIPAEAETARLVELASSAGSIQFRDVPLPRP